MQLTAILAGVSLMLMVAACSTSDDHSLADDDGGIDYVRNSEFTGPRLEVFLTLEDGRDVSVNTTDDAVATRPATTPIPGHRARDWTFVKDVEDGTSIAYALVSWDGDDPADYLMAGWWAEFPGQHWPDLSFADSLQYGIVDGPEIDPAVPPELPLAGQATYTGQAGGLYTYVPGSDWGEDQGASVIDEYEGAITLTADFAEATLSGCIGCAGDLVTRRAHFGIFLGDDVHDIRSIAADYELRLDETTIREDGTFEHMNVTVMHPTRDIEGSGGFWGGALSNIPDSGGNPRLAAGFSFGAFGESDGSQGRFVGAFVALSEGFSASPAE